MTEAHPRRTLMTALVFTLLTGMNPAHADTTEVPTPAEITEESAQVETAETEEAAAPAVSRPAARSTNAPVDPMQVLKSSFDLPDAVIESLERNQAGDK